MYLSVSVLLPFYLPFCLFGYLLAYLSYWYVSLLVLIIDVFAVSFILVRTGLQRFKPLDPNAPVPGRMLPPDNASLSSLSVGGVPRQKFLLVTIMDKDVSFIIERFSIECRK